jgi:predicted RNA-binding protein YlxR (DUF448 family)
MIKAAKTQQKKPKHLPLRTCIACRESKPKRELLRIVRTPEGHVLIDPTGKKSGRGAYLCAKLSCWQKALKEHRLEQVFEVEISAEDRSGIDEFIATLPKEDPRVTEAKPTKNPGRRKNTTEATS